MKQPLYNVLRREWQRMTSRRLYLGVCLVLPLFCLFFMATIFGSGQMENIPVGIVDKDNTATSRQIARNIAAVPTFSVTRHFSDEAAAREAVQRKEIYGYLSIPTGFEQRATTGMDATLSYYYHYALLSVGSELMAAFETALAPVALSPIAMKAISLGVNQEQITTFLLPVQSSMHPLYNPDLDYSVYLSQPFFYVLFQILILLMTVYAVGSELKFYTAQEWMTTARGNILTAVVGKLLPYTFIFSVIGILANYVLYGVLHIPFQGSLLMMNLLTVLFIIATQALAVFIFSTFPRIAYIISIVSMVGSLGATLSGVTFPVTSMYPPVHAASYLFPVRHFTEIAQSMLYFDSGFGYYWQSAAILLLFPLLALLILPRLRRWILKHEGEAEPHTQANNTAPLSLSDIISREWRAISTNPAILLVLIGGIFAYGLLYNLMYAPNLVRKTPVAVVDNSHSALSREYIRLLNATPQASVYALTPNYLEAKEWLKQSKVDGILYLPADFDARVGRGEQSVFSVYAATDAFLNFKNLQEASSRVMLAVNDVHRAEGAVFLPPQGVLAVTSSAPVNVSGTALYNYTEGYGSYLIPAVMIIIIFQTLLMVIGMITGEEAEKSRLLTSPKRSQLSSTSGKVILLQQTEEPEGSEYPKGEVAGGNQNAASPTQNISSGTAWHRALYNVSGRTFVYVMLYFIFALFLLGLLPHFFSIPNIGKGRDIITMMIPFLLGTSFFGLAASRYFTDSEAPLLMIAFFSVGYIFLSGVSYPLELMPWYWQAAHYVFPAAPAVLAFVKLNSMGGDMADIRPEMITLWIQVFVYFLLSLWMFRRKILTIKY